MSTTNISFTRPALLLIDVQVGFSHPTHWGTTRSTSTFETSITALLDSFRSAGHPVFHVAHHSVSSASPLNPKTNPGGEAFYEFATPRDGEHIFTKSVNSAFIGTDLFQALRDTGVRDLVIAGLTTDHCVSTSTRMAANLSAQMVNDRAVSADELLRVFVVRDACATWDKGEWDAETVHAVALASLDGEFATVVGTEEVVSALVR